MIDEGLIINTTKELLLGLMQANNASGLRIDPNIGEERNFLTIQEFGDRFKILTKKVQEAINELESGP